MHLLHGHKFKTIIRGNSKGFILPIVLALLIMGSISIIPFLYQMAAGVKSISVMRDLNINGYSANSGIEHSKWRLQFEGGFADSINGSSPTYVYSYPINSRTASITITWVAPMPSPSPTPPPGGSQSDRLSVEYSLVPTELLAGQATIVTVTIIARNIGANQIKFEQIGDKLPPGFTYIPGTASGYTTAEPAIQMVSGRQEVTWNWVSPHPTLGSGESVQQIFQASALPSEGIYYNEAWVIFVPNSEGTVYAGNATPVVAEYRKYDVMSKVGNITLKSRLGKNDINVKYLSWQW